MTVGRLPHQYDALKGRPQWSKDLGRHFASERQAQNETRRAAERKGARHG